MTAAATLTPADSRWTDAAPLKLTRPCHTDRVIHEGPAAERQREAEFTEFFHTYFPTVRARVRQLGHDDATTEDVCSGVFTLAHQRFDELSPLAEPQIRAWLFRTADYLGRNQRRSAIRYRRLIERLERQPLPEPTDPHDDYNRSQARDIASSHTRQVLASLDERHRTVLELADLEQHSGPEIARHLGITHQAARLRLMRARRAFQREYTQRYGASPTEGTP